VQGIGAAFFFIPLVSITLSGLAPDKIASASGLSSFLRTLAGSFGASLSQTLWNRRETFHHVQLTEQINAFSPLTRQGLAQIQGLGVGTAQGYGTIERLITNQAYMLSTNDVFWLAGWIFVALIPLVWLAKSLPMQRGVVVAADWKSCYRKH
jgi:DHA2 family multidrug resistance protein